MVQIVKQMEQWYTTELGKSLLATEEQLLSNILPRLFGYHLLQLNGPSNESWLSNCRIPHRIHLSFGCPCNFSGPCIVGKLEELPFPPDSMDVILMPHVLEFSEQPEQALQEAYSVLIPGGYLVIMGFQPWSLWGIAKSFKESAQPPWGGRFYSAHCVKKWLKQLGFGIEDTKTLFFRPPINNSYLLQQLFFMEILGEFLLPLAGGVYFILAKKRVASVIPIKAKLFSQLTVARGYTTQPTAGAHYDCKE